MPAPMNDLLPISATAQERALSLSTARVGDVPVPHRTLWNPDTCAVSLLPWLAWALSVETWDANWSEAVKRAVVRASIDTHRRKGTAGAVKSALLALGATSELVEWFDKDPVGTPHTFTVNLVSADSSLAMQAAMAREIDRTKPLRSHYDIVYGVATGAELNVVGLFRPAVFVRLDGGATY
jgi:phage tail P2-like protein